MRSTSTRQWCRYVPFLVVGLLVASSPLVAQRVDFVDPAIGRDLLNHVLPEEASYDSGTQYMMVDVFDVTVPGSSYGRQDGPPSEDSWYFVFPDQEGPPVVAYMRSLGETTGEAVRLQIASETPIRFNGEGVVLEPLDIGDAAQEALEREITRLAAGSPVTRVLNAYCLEFLKGPPSLDQMFRIADEQLQDLYRPAANILKASRSLIENGLLEDHPLDYVHSIKQWALWAAEGDFSEDSFSERFLAHAEDNFDAAGLAWNQQIEALVEETIPERWSFIERIIEEAAHLPGGAEWKNP